QCFGEARLSHSGEVLDDQMALREQAENGELQRFVRRVRDAREIVYDAFGQLACSARLEARICPHSLLVHHAPPRSASTSSRIATAHSSLLRLPIFRSPRAERRTISLSSDSNPTPG